MLKDAWRALRRTPGVSAVVIVSLGIGIGVNTAVFSWIEALALKPLPGVEDARAFYGIEARADTGPFPGSSWREYQDLASTLRSFDAVLAFRMAPLNVGVPGRTERAYALLVSGNYFTGLGLRPALGRLIQPDEAARPGAAPVVVVSHEYWRTHLGADPEVTGRPILANGRELTVIGVVPEAFQGTVVGLQIDLWVPATMAPALVPGTRELDDRGSRGYSLMGRLAAGVTQAAAGAELAGAMRRLADQFPGTNRGIGGEVLPFWRATRGPQGFFLQALALLQGVLLLLLVAVCGNTATLLLARAEDRRREVGVRMAVGATPWRVVRMVLAENLLLAVLGAALGVLIGAWGSTALRAVPLSTAFPVRFQTGLDLAGLAFAALLGVAAALAAGAAPAWQLARAEPLDAWRPGPRTPRGRRLAGMLVAAEVAVAVPVLLAAGLFVQSLRDSREIDPGFRQGGVLLAAYDLGARNPDEAEARRFASRLLAALGERPDVLSASIAASVPLDIHGMPLRGFALEGRARTDGGADRALRNIVTPGYFETMGIAIVAGTDFAPLDDPSAPPQAAVNEAFVRQYLPDGGAPIGRRLTAGDATYTITAVVADSRYESFTERPTPIIYYSYRDRPVAAGEIHVRTREGAEASLAAPVGAIVRALDATLPVYNVRTMTTHVETNLFLRRIPARIFAVLGPLLLLLAAIGVYAIVSHAVRRRTAEIGVRMALGATTRQVVGGFVGGALRAVAAGAATGWLLVVVVMLHLAPGQPFDLVVFGGVPLLLLLVSALASWLPARRAAVVDPAAALRSE
ncbi:MAG: ADOP family duplicated permease [Vicinamibacterales bacterium]